jgi:zinc protease
MTVTASVRRSITIAVLAAMLPSASSAGGQAPSDTATAIFEVAGIKVIHRPVRTNEVVAVNLYLLGGSRQVTPANAGIEPLLLMASEYGTRKYPGQAARRALAHTGSWITVSTSPDYTRFSSRGIKDEFDSTWTVFADRVMHPTLDSASVEIVRGKLLTEIKLGSESPDAMVERIADSLAFRNHPYAVDPQGTEASIAGITADAMHKYVREQMVTSRMLLAVVGNVPRAKLEQAIAKTLGTLPKGDYVWTLPPPWVAQKPEIATHARQLPTNYILGYFGGPQASSKDYPAFQLATILLSSIMSSEIRARGLSYSSYAPILDMGAAGGGVYSSTVRPDSVIKIVNEVIGAIEEGLLNRSNIVSYSESYLSRFELENELNSSKADILARAHLYYGDHRVAGQYADVIRKIGTQDVRRMARTYMKNIQYAFLGDTAKVPRKDMIKR